MKNKALFFSLLCAAFVSCSQTPKSPYEVPVSEADEPMMTGKFEPIGWPVRCIWKVRMHINTM